MNMRFFKRAIAFTLPLSAIFALTAPVFTMFLSSATRTVRAVDAQEGGVALSLEVEKRLRGGFGDGESELGLGDPADPLTWGIPGERCGFDPDTWQESCRRGPVRSSVKPSRSDVKKIVSTGYNGYVSMVEQYRDSSIDPDARRVINDEAFGLLGQVNTLRFVHVGAANVKTEHLKMLSSLPKLQILFLYECEVTNEGLRWVGQMKELRSLELDGNLFDDRGLKQLASLSKLVSLKLYYASDVADGGLAAALSGMKSLQFLWLGGNNIPDTELAGFSGMKSLRFLMFEGGHTTDAGLAHLGDLDSLETLHLVISKDGIRGPGLKYLPTANLHHLILQHPTDKSLEFVGRLHDLRILHLDLRNLPLADPSVTDKGLVCLHDLSRLEVLLASHAKISGAGLEHLTALKKLELDYASLNSANLKSLAPLKELRFLDLSWTPIDGDCLKYLGGLRNLEDLNVRGTRINNESFRCLDTLASLRRLDLTRCSCIDDGAAVFLGKLANLESLELSDTRLTEAALSYFHSLTKLKSLYLPNVSRRIDRSEELKRLQQALPKCQIISYPPDQPRKGEGGRRKGSGDFDLDRREKRH